jgi:SAM-dependent methyltransferase
MPLADRVLYIAQYMKNFGRNQASRKQFPEIALPPAYMLFEAFQLDYRKYWEGGKETALWLVGAVKPHLPEGELDVLDWGCGPARVLRQLPGILGEEHRYWGADYNPRTIAWCRRHLPGFGFDLHGILPPTGFADARFDFIYGISIFTHLSADSHSAWLCELDRLTRAGGILLLTTQGDAFREKLSDAERIRFDAGELVVRHSGKEGHRVFAAFQPARWARRFFGTRFAILEHRPGQAQAWGIAQDVWILQKEAPG